MDIGYVLLPSTLSPRATVMGYGNRWTPKNEKGKDSPSPGYYVLPDTLDKKGIKFVRESVLPQINGRFTTPGPGTYDFQSNIGKDSPKYTFHGSESQKYQNESPAPGSYSPKMKYTEYSGFKEITFGIGERKFYRKASTNVPGPGSYNISSHFDKYKTR